MTVPTPTTICVLGMHRSGTSFITRALSELGVYLGPQEHTIGPREDNPEGFSEHHYITHLNDEMLIELGGSWHTPPPLPPGWENDPRLATFAERARRILDEDFAAAPLWGWKDPRTCLTLPFWQRLVPSMRYVLCVRSPLAVALSLQTRDGFSIEKGGSLWVEHTAAALTHTSGRPRLLIAYDDIIERPELELARLSAFIGHPRADDRVAAVRAIANVSLRHHRTSLAAVLDDPRLPFAAKALYLATHLLLDVERHASDPEGPEDHARAVERLGEQAMIAQADAGHRRRLEEQLQVAQSEIAAWQGEANDLRRRLDVQLQVRLSERAAWQGEADDLRRRLAYRETARGSITAALRAVLPPRVYLQLRRAYDQVRAR